MTPDELLRLKLRARACDALQEVPSDLAGPVEETVVHHGFEFKFCICRLGDTKTPQSEPEPKKPQKQDEFSRCERSIVTVLAALGGVKLTTAKVLVELDRRGFRHGDCTVRMALARLTKAGVLVNKKDGKGYGLAAPKK